MGAVKKFIFIIEKKILFKGRNIDSCGRSI